MLEAIYSPGSAMDDKTIVSMKAGKADSLSRGDGNNKSLISWGEKKKIPKRLVKRQHKLNIH